MAERLVIPVEVDAKGVAKGVAEAQARLQHLQRVITDLDNRRIASLQKLEQTHVASERRITQQAVAEYERRLKLLQGAYAKQAAIVKQAEQQIARSQASAQAGGTRFQMPSLGRVGDVLGTLATRGAAAAVAGEAAAIKQQLDMANALRQVQRESGATIQQAAALAAQMQVLGVPVDTLSMAFRTLANQMEASPEQFAALGIATKDAEGNARPVVDVFNDLRDVIAASRGDSATLAVAQQLLGRGYQELLPYLQATKEDLAGLNEAAAASGVLMGQDAALAAERMGDAIGGLQISVQGFWQDLAQNAIPALTAFIENAAVAIDMLGALIKTGKNDALSNTPILGGLANLFRNTSDILTGNKTDALDTIRDRVDAQLAARQKIADIQRRARERIGQVTSGPSLAGATSSAIAARRQQVQEEAQLAQEALQAHLKAFEKERQAAIRTIQDQMDERQRAAEQEIQSIQDAQEAREEAARLRQRAREDETDGLREQLRLMDEAEQQEQRRVDLAEAEADLAATRNRTVFRNSFTSALDYYRAVDQKRKDERDAERRLADAKKQMARDEARERIEARLRALAQEAEAEQRSLEDARIGSQKRIEEIRRQMAQEKQQSEDRIRQLNEQIAKEREKTDEAVNGIKRLAAETLAQIATINAGYASIPRRIDVVVATTQTGGGSGGGGTTVKVGDDWKRDPNFDVRGNITSGDQLQALALRYLGRTLSPQELADHLAERFGQSVSQTIHDYRNSQEGQDFEFGRKPGGGGGGGVLVHDYPHSLTLNEPTLLTGMVSGRPKGVAAARGSEQVTFGGVGRGRSAEGGVAVNIGGISVRVDSLRDARSSTHREIDTVFDDLEAELAAENSYGFRSP